jgi:hypothetical protein
MKNYVFTIREKSNEKLNETFQYYPVTYSLYYSELIICFVPKESSIKVKETALGTIKIYLANKWRELISPHMFEPIILSHSQFRLLLRIMKNLMDQEQSIMIDIDVIVNDIITQIGEDEFI